MPDLDSTATHTRMKFKIFARGASRFWIILLVVTTVTALTVFSGEETRVIERVLSINSNVELLDVRVVKRCSSTNLMGSGDQLIDFVYESGWVKEGKNLVVQYLPREVQSPNWWTVLQSCRLHYEFEVEDIEGVTGAPLQTIRIPYLAALDKSHVKIQCAPSGCQAF